VSSGALDVGLGQAIGATRSFPVRGYRASTLRGRRAATATAEYRLPLLLIGRSLGHLPLGADKLALGVFADVGDAWEAGEDVRLHRLRSVGAELIGDLTVSYDLPLRLRLGVAQPAAGHAQVYVAFGADF
jgi:outer membrane protein assembly factor BamA